MHLQTGEAQTRYDVGDAYSRKNGVPVGFWALAHRNPDLKESLHRGHKVRLDVSL